MLKTISNYRDLSDKVRPVIKIRQDNDLINSKSVVYIENKIEQSQLIASVWSMMKMTYEIDVINHTSVV